LETAGGEERVGVKVMENVAIYGRDGAKETASEKTDDYFDAGLFPIH